MATNYKMTWRKEQGGRWRKVYKKKAYYFNRLSGETKEASYSRCWQLWLAKKAEIDAKPPDWELGLKILIRRGKQELARIELENKDTVALRKRWTRVWNQVAEFQATLGQFRRGHTRSDLLGDLTAGIDPVNPEPWDPPGEYTDGRPMYNFDDENPPWYYNEYGSGDGSLQTAVEQYLAERQAQAEIGKSSVARFEAVQGSIRAFADFFDTASLDDLSKSETLKSFHEHLIQQIDNGLSSYTARDRMGAVNQFCRWCYERDLIEKLPRILRIRTQSLSIEVQPGSIETFSDDDVATLLAAASDRTRLYLLLMLNCGMTQKDVADMQQSEVDWRNGIVTRKRSKTSLQKSVPTVAYKLWPETFQLLKSNRSKDKSLVLTNENGGPLKIQELVNGKVRKVDNVKSAFNRLRSKTGIRGPLKALRKTAATKLGSHTEYGKYAQYFLGHAPATVADTHYVKPDQEQFDAALDWLGQQFLNS